MVCSMSVKTRDAKSQKINNANIFRPDNEYVHNGHVHNVNWVGIKYVKIIVVKKKQEDMNKRWMEQFQLSQILAGYLENYLAEIESSKVRLYLLTSRCCG